MNGSCAGGTGAFVDEVASILKTPVEELNALAEKGECAYDISGRCGVYAKTDIQPLLNQGVRKEDLALSSFHAIAKQTIGGLAQGLDIEKPVVFEGGPLTFNPVLIRVFCERLGLTGKDAHCTGSAGNHGGLRSGAVPGYHVRAGERFFGSGRSDRKTERNGRKNMPACLTRAGKENRFFESEEEKAAFLEVHKIEKLVPVSPQKGETVQAYIGIDSGSTTTKLVLMDEKERILDSFYGPNEGEPLKGGKRCPISYSGTVIAGPEQSLRSWEWAPRATGSSFSPMLFSAECHVVETAAHARAAEKYIPDASFILDIGGQDMKAIWLDDGIITNIVVNEACSSGCGSFLEKFCLFFAHPREGNRGCRLFPLKNPAVLGSRCTVFYEQQHRDGAAKRKTAGGHYGGLMPLDYRERIYKGNPYFQSGFPGVTRSWFREEPLRMPRC